MGMATFMCSCSNEESIPGVQEPEVPGATEEKTEIKLGSSTASLGTRAAIKGDGSGSILGLSVWCLAKGTMVENMSPQEIVWFGTQPENKTCCIMKNVKANIVGNEVRWEDVTTPHYYPVTQFYRYEFYANYPYTTDVIYGTNNNSVSANYTIDGTQDLLWGRATSDDDYAWSAKYFRHNGGQTTENRPNIVLQHMLTRLVFHVKPGASVAIEGKDENKPEDEGEFDFTAARKMTVDSLQICNAYTKLNLIIADRTRLDMGIGARLSRTEDITDTLLLKGDDGAAVTPIRVPDFPSQKAQWGESIMLFPSSQYIVRLVLHDDAGRKYISEVPLVLSPKDGTTFERGNSYNIAITVHGPTVVTLGASVAEWNEVDGPDLNL